MHHSPNILYRTQQALDRIRQRDSRQLTINSSIEAPARSTGTIQTSAVCKVTRISQTPHLRSHCSIHLRQASSSQVRQVSAQQPTYPKTSTRVTGLTRAQALMQLTQLAQIWEAGKHSLNTSMVALLSKATIPKTGRCSNLQKRRTRSTDLTLRSKFVCHRATMV